MNNASFNVFGELHVPFCYHIWIPYTEHVEFKKENSAYQYRGSHEVKMHDTFKLSDYK